MKILLANKFYYRRGGDCIYTLNLERMLKEKILLRCCEDYSGLDGSFYRIAVKKHEENEILISVLRRCING